MRKKTIAVMLTMLLMMLSATACGPQTEAPPSSPGAETAPAPTAAPTSPTTPAPRETGPEPESGPSPTTPSPPRVEILSTSMYICHENLRRGGTIYKGDFVHIAGEVQNVGEENIKLKELAPKFYDKSGAEIDAPRHTLWPSRVLAPGQKLPFFVILLDEDASKGLADYEFSPSAKVTNEEPLLNLEVVGSTSTYMESMSSYNLYWIVGEYQNTGSSNIEYVWIFATFYDAEGTVLGYNYGDDPMLTVLPGQKVPFAVSSQRYSIVLNLPGDLAHRIASYELSFSYDIADEAPYREFEILSQSGQHKQEKVPILEEIEPVFEVEVEVKNAGNRQAQIVAIIVTFYDADGLVVDACWGHGSRYGGNRLSGNLKSDDLGPGETAQFTAKIKGDRALKVADYSLQVFCHKISD